jgi:CRISPR type III-A-associated RAMP protein Csm4
MNPGLIVKLRPSGPWRSGPDSGVRNRVDPIYHSDSLYAAVTSAMAAFGIRDEWLDATARSADGPAVRFSSCFPFAGEIGFIVPPRSIWPGGPASARVRAKSTRFIPLSLVAALLDGQTLREEQWTVDGASECLLPAGHTGPFRIQLRSSAAIDRMTGTTERHSTACIQFRPNAGFWAIVSFSDDAAHARWSGLVRGALRWLADSGFGGERSRGWGRCAEPEFVEGTLPEMILPDKPSRRPSDTATPPSEEPLAEAQPPEPTPPVSTEHWLLSLFTPGAQDAVDWQRGNYTVMARGGRIHSSAGFGERKKELQMVTEGSVLVAPDAIRGAAPDVAPDGFAHPVFRAGFALSIPLPAVTA